MILISICIVATSFRWHRQLVIVRATAKSCARDRTFVGQPARPLAARMSSGRGSRMKSRSKTGGGRDLFDIDRSILLNQVNALKLTVRNALTELAMIAAENVFDQPLTAKLKQNALALKRMGARLDALARVLARAKLPAPRK